QSGTDGVYTASFTLTADEAAQYRGSVSFTAADAAGNVSAVFDDSDKNTLVADTIPPSVRIAYGGKLQDKVRPDASRGSVPEEDVDSATRFIYAGAITVGVEATEANFYPNGSQNGGEYGEDDILITASRTLDGDTATYPLEYAKGDWARDGDTWTLTFALSGDGDYTVEMTYRDRSRNDMAWSSGEYEGKSGDGGAYGSNLLTIDTTPPAIEVAWTPETSASSYKDVHRTDRTAVIRVKERNFRPYEISVPTLTATDIRGGAATMFDAEALIERLRSWEAWEETSLNIWETSVTFSADARYEFALEYTDPAGNAAERYEAAPFTVDHTPPSGLSVTYSEPLLGKLIELVTFGYYNPSVTVTLTASDNTSGVDFFDWTYTRSPEASPVKNAASESARIPAGGIAYGGGTVTTSFVLTADEAKQYSGSISFTARDRAGNTGASYDDSASNAIIVDTISPTRAVIYPAPRQIIDASDMTTIAEDAAEDPAREDRDLILYYDGPVSLTLRVTEANFYAEDIAVEVNDEAPGLEWIKTGGEATDDHEAEIRLAEDGDYVIAVSYTDRSSNEMVSYESERITIDTADPVISVTYSPDEAARAVDGRGYFGGARTAELTVTERNFRADDIEALIEALDSSGGETAGAFAEGLAESLRRRESWTEDGGAHTAVVTYSADANYTFDIAYRDLARREAADYAPDLFTVDTAPPVNHGVAYSESLLETMLEAVTLGFYSARVTVTVSADDDTSGVYGFVYGGTGADGGAPAELYGGEITYGGIEYRDGGRRAEASFEMPKKEAGGGQFDGFVAFTAYDRPGNSSGATGARRIVVDDIAPAVAVTYSAPVRSAGGVRYYAGDIRAAIEVTEANFFAEDVSVLIEKNGGAPAAVSPVWTDGGAGRHTGEFTLTGDGAYTAAVTYTDRSGNEMADYRSERLVIDTKKPVIRLEGIAHESANNGGIIGFTLTAEDENFDIASFAPRLTAIVAPGGAFKTEELPPGTLRIAASGGAYSYVTENLAEDGIYSLVCEAADMSGNAAEEIAVAASGDAAERTVRFSVNRRGSAFMPDENAARLVEAYYVREVYDDIAIIETNADPLLSYKAALNGKELRENEDYAVSFERAGGDDGWYKYTYAFKKELFAAEGEYTLVASSRDKAENDAYSDIKSAEIAFVTDRTAPVLTVAGLRQDGRYQAERQSVTIVPRDDGGKLGSLTATASSGGAESVLLELRGDELLDAIDGGGGALGFAIPSGIGWDVRIVCGDVAVGRDGETNTYDVTFKNVTVSTNAIVIFYANTPVFLGTAAGAALSVGGGAALAKLLKVRKRKGA
ncbi:MAG: hypothetical protein LBD49_00435, partial [Oscillospiraceae bacterium]|nr:hypothetical protein [Oscillospiraceae bacterium]